MKVKRRDVLTTFHDLGAHPQITDALTRAGIDDAFPIQQLAIPIALTGADLIGQARTGTGKTLAFGVPLLQRIVCPSDRDFEFLDAPGQPQALVVTPTRELALQVTADLKLAGSDRQARVLTVYGGVGYESQLEALETGIDVVVGTPGRLLDLADRGALELTHVRMLVLDEADRMLDLGFLPDVERLIGLTHELRQTMLFSATMPGDIVQLARRHMRHPMNVRAESSEESLVVPATAQFVYRAHDLDKQEMLARILQAESRGRVIIFCTTKRAAGRVTDDLSERGFAVAAIHGDLSQVLREKSLQRFRNGKVDVLVATDVAARGIDIEGVTHVINYTCPDDEKTYLHRIGRTGRAGATGVAVTFVDWKDTARWKVINETLDLPFDEPAETYSTSDHFHSDLGIPKDATGRLTAPTDAGGQSPDRPRRNRSRRRTRQDEPARSDGPAGKQPASSEETPSRPRRSRDRPRQRTRNGEVIAESGNSDADDGSAASTGTDHATPAREPGAGTQPPGQPGARRRRRRRRSTGTDVGGSTDSDADNSSA